MMHPFDETSPGRLCFETTGVNDVVSYKFYQCKRVTWGGEEKHMVVDRDAGGDA
jgi:hypothetical protein